MNPKNESKNSSEEPALSDEKNSFQDSKFVLIMFFIISIILIATQNIWSGKGAKKKQKNNKDEFAFKKDLAKQYGVKTDTLMNWLIIICPEGCGIEIICSPIKKLPKEIIHLYLGVPEPGKDYSKAALAKECNVSRNILNSRFKKIEWPDTDMMISREDYKNLRVLPPRIFESLKFMHECHYPPIADA